MFGRKYRDILSGFEGTCTGITEYISGCRRFLLQPVSDDPNKVIEPQWFDEVTCEEVGEPMALPEKLLRAIQSLSPGTQQPKAITGPGREPPKH